MKTKDKALTIIAVLAVFCYLLFLIKSTLTPFVCSLVIAYFLNPLVNFSTKRYGLSRLTATSIILGLFIYTIAVICLFLLPAISNQLSALIHTLPEYFKTISNVLYPKISETLGKAGIAIDSNLYNLIGNEKFATRFAEISQNVLNNALTSSMTFVNILSLIFITPILVFYFLKDWNILIKKVSDYLPRKISIPSKKIARNIDKTLSGYLRGQFHVCIILAIVYALLLSMAGLDFGFTIGFLTGFFSFIPYVGMLCGITVGIIIAIIQWGFDFMHIGGIALIFLFGQILESNFLTPKLIGDKIGLHPVWLIFGLFAFGALFGFIGILIAVPLTAICGVIIKHFAIGYKKKFT